MKYVMAVIVCAACFFGRAWAADESYGSSRTERTIRPERVDRGERTYRTDRTNRPLREYEQENVPAKNAENGDARKERKTPVFKEW